MERLSYDEAKNWFWLRTWIWSAVVALVSVIACFIYSGEAIRRVESRAWLALGVGIGVTLTALFAAYLTLQLPWMRRGWRRGFVLNGPVAAGIAGAFAWFAFVIIMNFVMNDPLHPPPARVMNAADQMMWFSAVAAALWGFVYGSWFAMRRDAYFVEPI